MRFRFIALVCALVMAPVLHYFARYRDEFAWSLGSVAIQDVVAQSREEDMVVGAPGGVLPPRRRLELPDGQEIGLPRAHEGVRTTACSVAGLTLNRPAGLVRPNAAPEEPS